MRERSPAINAFTAEEVGEFYKDNVSGFTMTRGGVNKRGKCRRSIKQFIARKIYNHRVFITLYVEPLCAYGSFYEAENVESHT